MGMNSEKFHELENRASLSEEMDHIKKLEARSHVQREIEAMKSEGAAFELSDEEVKMLRAFRRFKLRMRRDGETFTWQTRRPDGVQIVEETAEIVHPSEIAE